MCNLILNSLLLSLNIFCIIFLIPFSHGHGVFTAFPDLESLLNNELQVTDIIDRFVDKEIEKLNLLKEDAKRYRSFVEYGLDLVSNPVDSYITMRRMYNDWQSLQNTLKNDYVEALLSDIRNHRKSIPVRFPEIDDLKGAAIALMRLQDVYDIDVDDLAKGRIKQLAHVKAGDGALSAIDCFNFGQLAFDRSDYYHALLWLQESLKRLAQESPEQTDGLSKVDILHQLSYSMFQQGNYARAVNLTKEWLAADPDNGQARRTLAFYQSRMKEMANRMVDSNELPPVLNHRQYSGAVAKEDIYEALCRNERQHNEAEKAKLYCYYKMDTPYLKLAPVKVEIVNLKPKMVLFRKIVSDNEISVIQGLINNQLNIATVVSKDGVKHGVELSDVRTAKSGWLYSGSNEIVRNLNKRLDDITNLNSQFSEDIHIVKYNIAGHYEPHYDFFNVPGMEEHEKTDNDRMATLIFYFSTPEAGGATVFPEIDVALFPTKNDAVFWYNLHLNGSIDLNTRHGACPVLSGTKWVGNKWIRERGQEFTRKCNLDRYAYE